MRAIVDTEPPRRPSPTRGDGRRRAPRAADAHDAEAPASACCGATSTTSSPRRSRSDPAERYASVEALADDLRRYLAHEPMRARPTPSAIAPPSSCGGTGPESLSAPWPESRRWPASSPSLWQAREARRQRDTAQAQLARATASSEFLGFLLSAAAPTGQKFVVADLLREGEEVVEKQFGKDDPLRAELLAGIGMQYLSAQRWEKAQPVLERAEKVASRSSDPALRARARCPLALAYVVAGDTKRGEELISRTMADLPGDSPHALARAECLTRWSEFGFFTDEGEPMVRRASEALEAVAGAPVPSLLTRLDAQSALAYGYYLTRQNAKADAAFAELTKLLEQNGRDRTLAAADAWNNWGLVHHRGDIRKAEPLYRRSLELHRAIEGSRRSGRPPQLRRRPPAAGAACRSRARLSGGDSNCSRQAEHLRRDRRDAGARRHVRRDRPPCRGAGGDRHARPLHRNQSVHSPAPRLSRLHARRPGFGGKGKRRGADAVRRVGPPL